MVVHPSVPVKTVKELVALAKARPAQVNFASGGTGSSTHLGVELLKSVAGIQAVHIPYKGTGPAVSDVLGGTGDHDVRRHQFGEAARQGRPDARDCGHRRPAFAGDAGSADVRRVGLRGVDSGTYWGCLAPAATPRDTSRK